MVCHYWWKWFVITGRNVFQQQSHWATAVRTRQQSLCLARCLWPSAAGWKAWVEEEEAQGRAKAPEDRRHCRCWRGFWLAACTCASWVRGGPWWGWTTGCSRLWRNGTEELSPDQTEDRRRLTVKSCLCGTRLTAVDDGVSRVVSVRIVVI